MKKKKVETTIDYRWHMRQRPTMGLLALAHNESVSGVGLDRQPLLLFTPEENVRIGAFCRKNKKKECLGFFLCFDTI